MAKQFPRPRFRKQTIQILLTSVVLAISLVLLAVRCSAQTDQGAITGVVQDPTGAVIPNADVTVTNVDTGLILDTKSNSSGVFVFSPLKSWELHGVGLSSGVSDRES